LNHAFELNNGTNVDVSLEVDVRKT
jgi:hypothetical protein